MLKAQREGLKKILPVLVLAAVLFVAGFSTLAKLLAILAVLLLLSTKEKSERELAEKLRDKGKDLNFEYYTASYFSMISNKIFSFLEVARFLFPISLVISFLIVVFAIENVFYGLIGLIVLTVVIFLLSMFFPYTFGVAEINGQVVFDHGGIIKVYSREDIVLEKRGDFVIYKTKEGFPIGFRMEKKEKR